MEDAIPKTRTSNYELNFANDQVSWAAADESDAEESSSGGMTIRIMSDGSGGIDFFEPGKLRKVQQREIAGKQYLVLDTIRKLDWKLTEETRTILGHLCRKAVAQVVGKRMSTVMNNGQLERTGRADTTNTIAWFTADIPVSAGPELQAQLPGLILRLEMRDGSEVYDATAINSKPDLSTLKEPTKGKKVTQAEFDVAQQKMVDEMMNNRHGDGIRLQVSQ